MNLGILLLILTSVTSGQIFIPFVKPTCTASVTGIVFTHTGGDQAGAGGGTLGVSGTSNNTAGTGGGPGTASAGGAGRNRSSTSSRTGGGGGSGYTIVSGTLIRPELQTFQVTQVILIDRVLVTAALKWLFELIEMPELMVEL